MHIINDISLLVLLGKNGVLELLRPDCEVAISAVRLSEYSVVAQQGLKRYCPLVQQLFSDPDCSGWSQGKTVHLSLGDLDSLYIAKVKDIPLICSEKDFKLEELADQQGIQHEATDSFIRRMVGDSSGIKIYNLLKAI
jgi:hypothetical protein